MTGASDFPAHCALMNMTSVIFALINFDFFKQLFDYRKYRTQINLNFTKIKSFIMIYWKFFRGFLTYLNF